MLRALNSNQILILSKLASNRKVGITEALSRISSDANIPLSTLKLNTKVLRELGLIEVGSEQAKGITITRLGKLVLTALSDVPSGGCEFTIMLVNK